MVSIGTSCDELGLQRHPFILDKVIQLYSMTLVRHGMMLVGPTGGGKTMNYKILQASLSRLHEMEKYEKVHTAILNPKSITMGQLYGQFDDITHEWADGVLANQLRLFTQDTLTNDGKKCAPEDKKWIIFDGPVDAIWIENMNTVLDDNKKLCLNSGEIIKMTESMVMMFEVEDLAVASPATVSRCGMIYMEPKSLGTRPLVQSWLQYRIPEAAKPHAAQLQELFDTYLDGAIRFLRRNLAEPVPTTTNGVVESMLNLFDCFLKPYFENPDRGELNTPDGEQSPSSPCHARGQSLAILEGRPSVILGGGEGA